MSRSEQPKEAEKDDIEKQYQGVNTFNRQKSNGNSDNNSDSKSEDDIVPQSEYNKRNQAHSRDFQSSVVIHGPATESEKSNQQSNFQVEMDSQQQRGIAGSNVRVSQFSKVNQIEMDSGMMNSKFTNKLPDEIFVVDDGDADFDDVSEDNKIKVKEITAKSKVMK